MRSETSVRAWSRAGFTLIELLLVLAIIAVVTAVIVPDFVRSMRRNQRRVAVRTVIASGRYARSMAALKQVPMQLTFDLDNRIVEVAPLVSSPHDDDADPLDSDDDTAAVSPPVMAAEMPDRPRPAAGTDGGLMRELGNISIEAVIAGEEEIRTIEGRVSVTYQRNGRCQPYTVKLVDTHGEAVAVAVDALATPSVLNEADTL